MIYFSGTILEDRTVWEVMPYYDSYLDDGVTISFPLPYQLKEREALNYLKQHLQAEEREWLQFDKGNTWIIDLSKFKAKYSEEIKYGLDPSKDKVYDPEVTYLEMVVDTKLTLDLFEGVISLSPEVGHHNDHEATQTTVRFVITYEQLIDSRPRRVFLSYKSADREVVKDFKDTLVALGYAPWMDEDQLVAGDKLHRGLLKAFNESIAAIFFITENFRDEKYLAAEIDYATNEATEREDFRIITLILGEKQSEIQVPSLLKQYVYKTPTSMLQALREVLKALNAKPNFR